MKGWLTVLACALGLLAIRGDGAPRRICRTRCPVPEALVAQTRPDARMKASVRLDPQTDVVDVLVAFDDSARAWLVANGKGEPLAYARTCVAKMNDCLGQSELTDHFRFRLAGAVRVDADLSGVGWVLDDVLDRFVNGWGQVVAEGALRKVADRREDVGADIVTVLTARGSHGIVGVGFSLEMMEGGYDFVGTPAQIANFGNWAYSVCSIQAVDEDHTMLHEVGHVMGAGHPNAAQARAEDFELGPQLYDYSSGFYFWRDGVGYYTVMAYNFGGPGPDGDRNGDWHFEPAPCFSSPEITWKGCTVGSARNDNRRTLIETCHHVARFRVSQLPVGSTGVTDAANAAAEKAWDDEHEGGTEGDEAPVAGFAVTGAFRPEKAMNGLAPYVGAVYSNGVAVGTVQLKVGKANARKGTCKVGGAMVLVDGRKYNMANVEVPIGDVPQRAEDVVVKGLGRMTLRLGANGFAGVLGGTPWGSLEVRTRMLDGRLTSNPAVFQLEASETELSAACGAQVLSVCLPNGEPVASAANGKWVLRRGGSVSYKQVKDPASGTKVWTLVGTDDPKKPNLSGLKLSVAQKTATFKGGFTLYVDVGSEAKPRLKKAKLSVTGVVVDGKGYGVAVLKGAGRWPVWIR